MVQSENPTSIAAAFTSTKEQPTQQPLNKTVLWNLTTVILILMIITTVFGNTLVLVTTWVEKRLHQPNKYFIACLAVADLTVGLFSIPIRLHLHLNQKDLMAVELCRFWNWIDIACEVASIVTLTIISIDRYLKISMLFKYRSLMTTTRSVILIFFILLISIVHATLGLLSYAGSLGVKASSGGGCVFENVIYLTVTAAVFFFVPSFIMIVMYALIFFIAHRRRAMARNGTLGQSFITGNKKVGKEILQELKTLRMLFLVVGTFILCWGPFFTIFLLNTYKSNYVYGSLSKEGRQIIVTIFTMILPSFNSLCNPVIYACFDREYSKAFKHLFQRILCCRNSREEMTAKFSKGSTTQSLRLKELRSSRTSKSLQATSEVEENCLAKTSLL